LLISAALPLTPPFEIYPATPHTAIESLHLFLAELSVG